MKHTPTVGTVLSMTPASGRVRFTAADSEEWTLPLIGWAVVVSWVRNSQDLWMGVSRDVLIAS